MIIPPRLGIAVPEYMEEIALNAELPPGHKFNLYAPMWIREIFMDHQGEPDGCLFDLGPDIKEIIEKRKDDGKIIREGRDRRESGKFKALKTASSSYPNVIIKFANAIFERQKKLAENINAYIIPINLISPLAIGMGNPHPVENGFAFLSPYGLPYVAGSSIKGVLRHAADEMELDQNIKELLFGNEDQNNPKRGALTFWDGFPQCVKMAIEVMTPHQSGYYSGDESPHDQGQPTPIPFLVVPDKTKMNLIIHCEDSLLNGYTVDWAEEVRKIVEYAGKWLGFGAKTAVGYGSFKINQTELNANVEIFDSNRINSQNSEEQKMLKFKKELTTNQKKFREYITMNKVYEPRYNNILLPIINSIFEKCEALRTDECKDILNKILAYLGSNKNSKAKEKKREYQAKYDRIFNS